MVRNVGMSAEHAQLGFMTPHVWMFIGTYEKLRKFVIQQNTITCLIQLEYSQALASNCSHLHFHLTEGLLSVMGLCAPIPCWSRPAGPRAFEALANPECGWFYRADASGFEAIPGKPDCLLGKQTALDAFFQTVILFSDFVTLKSGFLTGR